MTLLMPTREALARYVHMSREKPKKTGRLHFSKTLAHTFSSFRVN